MKYLFIFIALLYSETISSQIISGSSAYARKQFVDAQNRIKVRDYGNAIIELSELIVKEPNNIEFQKVLSQTYFTLKDFDKSLIIILPTLNKPDVDEACFQIASNIYINQKKFKEAKNVINNGLEKFPNSGNLYNSKGELLYSLMKDDDALEAWELGIKKDPAYPYNYFYAAKILSNKETQFLKTILYSETFINLDKFSTKSEEMKRLLLASYQKLYTNLYQESDFKEMQKWKKKLPIDGFERECINIFIKNKMILLGGLNTNNLTMFRIRFLLDYNANLADKYPYELFTYCNQLLSDGNFSAYNQWIFGNLMDPVIFKSWAQNNADVLNKFTQNMQNLKFIPLTNQYYFN